MRPWQARKEKSQKIRKVEGRILYGRDGSSCLLEGGDSRTVGSPAAAHSRCEVQPLNGVNFLLSFNGFSVIVDRSWSIFTLQRGGACGVIIRIDWEGVVAAAQGVALGELSSSTGLAACCCCCCAVLSGFWHPPMGIPYSLTIVSFYFCLQHCLCNSSRVWMLPSQPVLWTYQPCSPQCHLHALPSA